MDSVIGGDPRDRAGSHSLHRLVRRFSRETTLARVLKANARRLKWRVLHSLTCGMGEGISYPQKHLWR